MLPQKNGPSTSNKAKANPSRQVASRVPRSGDFGRFYVLVVLFVLCTVFYYFGELVDFAGWKALRWEFFYGVHDTHRLLFLAPIIYAGYFFGVRAAIIVTIIAVNTFLPRAILISPFPDPLLRIVLFIVVAGAIGYLTGRQSERSQHLETLVRRDREQTIGVLERMEEGVLIVGPDYRIRFANPSMIRDFGEGVGSHCYQYLHKFDGPCLQICKLPSVTNGAIERWDYKFPDGRTCEVLASPWIDSDGTVCQLAIFRSMAQRTKG